MAKLATETECDRARHDGVLVGKTTPSRDTKGCWYEVYELPDCFIAVIRSFDDYGDAICGEILTRDEIDNYMEEPYPGSTF